MAEPGDLALRRGRSGPFGITIDKLVRGCAVQGAEFDNWPFDAIARTVNPDENQRKALDALRDAAKQAAQRLAAECPQDVPAAPAARLEAAEQGIAATFAGFDTVEPKLQAFYAALSDEQKALPRHGDASRGQRGRDHGSPRGEGGDRWRAYAAARESATREGAARQAAAAGWKGMCEELGSVLRNWPVREIERDVRLFGQQRIAFYELVTSSLKAADTLGSACPADAALTPVGRMELMRKRLAAVRAATAAIRPALARFYEALDLGQKVRFAGMRYATRHCRA